MNKRLGNKNLSRLPLLALVTLSAFSVASNAEVTEQEPNNTIEQAQAIPSHFFNLSPSDDIAFATESPHVTINGNQPAGVDYYRITVEANSKYVFDIDYAEGAGGSFDSYLVLYDAAGNALRSNDDSDARRGAGGSYGNLDSYLEYFFVEAGFYYISVSACCGSQNPIPDSGTYKLQISQGSDPDSDGLSNKEERVLGTDPFNADTDGDGWNDGFEVDYQLNPLIDDRSFDPDYDGLINEDEVANGSSPVNADSDGDTLNDALEVNVFGTSPALADSDFDGLSDSEEINVYRLNPNDSDSDNDGMADGWEVMHGLNPMLATDDRADQDGDGWLNLQEFQRNSNPVNSSSVPNTENALLYSITGSRDLIQLYLATGEYDVIGNLGINDDYEGLAVNPIDSKLYAVGDSDENLYRINTITGQATLIGSLGAVDSEYGLSFDDAGNLYLIDGDSFYRVDLNTGAASFIASGDYGDGLAWHQGAMYSIGDGDELRLIDVSTGSITVVGLLGVGSGSQAGLTSTGDQLIGLSESGGKLFSINTTTGSGSLISTTQAGIESLAFGFFQNTGDNDGLDDTWENDNGLDSNNPNDAKIDSDNDGLINLQEYLNGGDPFDPDSDGDGISDGEEFFVYRTDLNDSDTDNDGIKDGYEVSNDLNPLVNDRAGDLDGDRLSNLLEFQNKTRANSIDSDNDGLTDYEEVVIHNSNPLLFDTDGDKLPDVWEAQYNLSFNSDDRANDLDGDNLTNLEEFRANTNPRVRDTDGDGLDDDVEIRVYRTNPIANDSDNDGLSDSEEINTYHTNPGNGDSDNDGMPDGWEVEEGLNPSIVDTESDSDGDGLSNLEEYNRGSSPALTDTDGDGINDANDADNETDNGVPTLIAVPEEMSISADAFDYQRGTMTLDNAFRANFTATDAVDSVLNYSARINGELLVMNRDDEIFLPTGRNVISWTAVDSAGNESNAMEQIINVYPRVFFAKARSVTGEMSTADIEVKLSGPSPVYPVVIELVVNAARTTVSQSDVDVIFDLSVNKTITIEAGSDPDALNTSAVLTVPVMADGESEADETLGLDLQGVIQTAPNLFVLDNVEHNLVITEKNLAPSVTLIVSQAGSEVEAVDTSAGEVSIQALIRDPNGKDSHSIVWKLPDLNVVSDAVETDIITFDPATIPSGQYLITAVVTDDAVNPMVGTGDVLLAVSSIAVEPEMKAPVESEGKSSGGSAWIFVLLMMMFAFVRTRT